MQRGYHMIWLWCAACRLERPFWRFERYKLGAVQPRIWRRKSGDTPTFRGMSPNVTPNLAPDARLVRAYCMACDHSATYIITDRLWRASLYPLDFLCICGLPWDHECPHLEVKHE